MESIREQWPTLHAEYTDTDLRIGGHDVMQAWERPLMEAMAKGVTRNGGDILEIGYGMGISASAIIRHGCRSYHVIEAHPEVRERAKRCGLRTIKGFWENVVPAINPESFDGILFDTFPLDRSYFDNPAMFTAMARLLRPGGVFTYFTGQTHEIPHADMKSLLGLYRKVEVERISGLSPPKDCKYPCGETMLAVFATK